MRHPSLRLVWLECPILVDASRGAGNPGSGDQLDFGDFVIFRTPTPFLFHVIFSFSLPYARGKL